MAQTPAPVFHAAVIAGRQAQFVGRFNLDPRGDCPLYNYSGDPNVEPDLGPTGADVCGTPPTVRITLRLYKGQQLVYSTASATTVHAHRGVWRKNVRCFGTRWVATLVNPWGSNRVSSGSLRCKSKP